MTSIRAEEIERALTPLVGLALWGPARAANMLSLQLGEPRDDVTAPDQPRRIGDYAIHVFCPWRLTDGSQLVAGAGDLFTPADPDADLETFDWDEVGSTWWDVRLREFFEAHPLGTLRVESVTADVFGGCRLTCTGGVAFETFPSSSDAPHVETEYWRLFQPGTPAPHFVVQADGIHRHLDA